MRCAVVGGTGWQGAGIATRIAAAGWTAVIGSRDLEKAKILQENLPPFVGLPAERFEAATNIDAVKDAEVVFITVPSTGHRAVLESIKDHLDDEQIIVDVTAPVDPDNHLSEIWPEDGSYTAEAQEVLGDEFLVVGAFKNVSATMLLNHTMPPNCDILICGDDLEAKHQVQLWIKQMGFQAYDIGKVDAAPTMEGLTKLLIFLNYAYHLNQPGIKFQELSPGMQILPDDDLFVKKS